MYCAEHSKPLTLDAAGKGVGRGGTGESVRSEPNGGY